MDDMISQVLLRDEKSWIRSENPKFHASIF